MKNIFKLSLFLFLLFLLSCFRQGQPAIMDKELISQLKPGVTNSQQVISLFGNPQKRMTTNTGDEEWEYFYAKNVTAFSGEAHALKLQFDRSGVLKTYSFGRVH